MACYTTSPVLHWVSTPCVITLQHRILWILQRYLEITRSKQTRIFMNSQISNPKYTIRRYAPIWAFRFTSKAKRWRPGYLREQGSSVTVTCEKEERSKIFNIYFSKKFQLNRKSFILDVNWPTTRSGTTWPDRNADWRLISRYPLQQRSQNLHKKWI